MSTTIVRPTTVSLADIVLHKQYYDAVEADPADITAPRKLHEDATPIATVRSVARSASAPPSSSLPSSCLAEAHAHEAVKLWQQGLDGRKSASVLLDAVSYHPDMKGNHNINAEDEDHSRSAIVENTLSVALYHLRSSRDRNTGRSHNPDPEFEEEDPEFGALVGLNGYVYSGIASPYVVLVDENGLPCTPIPPLPHSPLASWRKVSTTQEMVPVAAFATAAVVAAAPRKDSGRYVAAVANTEDSKCNSGDEHESDDESSVVSSTSADEGNSNDRSEIFSAQGRSNRVTVVVRPNPVKTQPPPPPPPIRTTTTVLHAPKARTLFAVTEDSSNYITVTPRLSSSRIGSTTASSATSSLLGRVDKQPEGGVLASYRTAQGSSNQQENTKSCCQASQAQTERSVLVALKRKEEDLQRLREAQCGFPVVSHHCGMPPTNGQTVVNGDGPNASIHADYPRQGMATVNHDRTRNERVVVGGLNSISGSRGVRPVEEHEAASRALQPTPYFERLVTEEVQELKAYARLIENQNRRLAELERIHGDLETRLEVESRGRQQLEGTLEAREREWTKKFEQLGRDRDHWKEVVQAEQTKNARLKDQVLRKDQDIHRMLQRKYDNDATRTARNYRQAPSERFDRPFTNAGFDSRADYQKSPHEILADRGSIEKARVRNVKGLLLDFFGM